MNKVKVSLVMTVFNGEKFIKQAVDSVLAQSYGDFEIIVVDDLSTDGTIEILSSYKVDNLKVIKNEQNLGTYKSANIGIAAASGEYIARLDADDVCLPGRFVTQVDFLDRNPHHVLVGSHAETIDEDGNKIGMLAHQQLSFDEVLTHIFFHNTFVHSSIMFRKSFFDKFGGYRELAKAQDYEYYLRMISHDFKLENLGFTLVKYRIHTQSMTMTGSEAQELASREIIIEYLDKILGIKISEKTLELIRKIFLKNEYKVGFLNKIQMQLFFRKFQSAFNNKFPDHSQNLSEELDRIRNQLS